MAKLLAEYSTVEVVKLSHAPEHYDGWKLNKRPPVVGDRGTVVEILKTGNQVGYIVEAVSTTGVPDWVGDFEPDEIRPLGDAR